MNNIKINNTNLQLREYKGQRVVTFKDIDLVHQRPKGTANRNFKNNEKHFIENVDFYKISPYEIRRNKLATISDSVKRSMLFFTESGYLMLVKSFTDDLAWEVQRQLVNCYFRNSNLAFVDERKSRKSNRIIPATKTDRFKLLLKLRNLDEILMAIRRYSLDDEMREDLFERVSVEYVKLGLLDEVSGKLGINDCVGWNLYARKSELMASLIK